MQSRPTLTQLNALQDAAKYGRCKPTWWWSQQSQSRAHQRDPTALLTGQAGYWQCASAKDAADKDAGSQSYFGEVAVAAGPGGMSFSRSVPTRQSLTC
jgi:hypothetical protein